MRRTLTDTEVFSLRSRPPPPLETIPASTAVSLSRRLWRDPSCDFRAISLDPRMLAFMSEQLMALVDHNVRGGRVQVRPHFELPRPVAVLTIRRPHNMAVAIMHFVLMVRRAVRRGRARRTAEVMLAMGVWVGVAMPFGPMAMRMVPALVMFVRMPSAMFHLVVAFSMRNCALWGGLTSQPGAHSME